MLKISELKTKFGNFELSLEELKIKKGSLILLMGPNGSGKSTMLKSLAGLISYSGKVLVDDKKVESLSYKDRAKTFAYLPQRVSVSEMLVRDFVLTGRFPYTRILSGYSEKDVQMVQEVSLIFGIQDYLDRDISALSQGEFQRVLLAKVFVQNPNILLLDEPTTSLDMGYKHSVKEQILNYKQSNKDAVIIISTHEPELFKDLANGFIMLKKGRVFKKAEAGTYDDNDLKGLFDLKFC